MVAGCIVVLAGFMLLVVAAMFLIPQPESIDTDPLEEVLGGLDLLKEPAQHCPESADACWGSVVVASGESRSATIDRATRNAVTAGYVQVASPLGRWTVQRGEMCLSLYEPAELLVYEAAEFPADAMYIGINRC